MELPVFEKILFPTDFSEYAKKTLDCIAGFPGAREVVLFHAIEDVRSPRGGGEIGDVLFRNREHFLKEERQYLENLNQNLRVTTAAKISSDIAGAIIETAEEKGVALIVVGARGKSVAEGILLGSVSVAVLRRSTTNVLIMRHKIIESLTGKTFEMFCPMILSRVLCPIDFSRFSERAIDILSRTIGVGEVVLLHVVSQDKTEAEIEHSFRTAKSQIEAIRSSLAVQGIEVRSIIRAGEPASWITRIADEEEASAIWMSSHGKGWFQELLLGSTADTVAMNAKRPVIIIRRHPETGVNE
jgi:nucleotide-binding universal stress UspA family protein